MEILTIYCIDGSGNKDEVAADRKRPIYGVDLSTGEISRALLKPEQTALEFFISEIERCPAATPVLIAADVPIGLPASPADVYDRAGANTFVEWLLFTEARLKASDTHWRNGLIARGIASRSADTPFVSLLEGENKHAVAGYRYCDKASNAESIYCLDHIAKQVVKAALQFWFDILLPMRRRFGERVAVWFRRPGRSRDSRSLRARSPEERGPGRSFEEPPRRNLSPGYSVRPLIWWTLRSPAVPP